MAHFEIDHAGPLITIQDKGRTGFMRFGVTPSGPMDRVAYLAAHHALGADLGAAIEISMGGLSISCQEGQVSACITGGDFKITLDGEILPSWSIFTLRQGSRLQVQAGKWGSWCYLVFAGKMIVPTWLNSASTHVGSDLCGTPLSVGNIITVEDCYLPNLMTGQVFDPKLFKPQSQIRIVLGPQDHFFTSQSVQDLQNEKFILTKDFNRQGVRLNGPKLKIIHALDMPSEPVGRGSLQVPGHGDPICLLADHQTTGGYPKIATVISADQDKLSQMRSGDKIFFKVVSVEAAIVAAKIAHEVEHSFYHIIKDSQKSLEEKLWNSNLVSGIVSDINS